MNMRMAFSSLVLCLALSSLSPAAEIQGVLADWKCTKKMVRDGRAQVLKQDSSCSLVPNSARKEYGLITDGKKFYHFDKEGNRRAKMLLNDSHDKDNLRVMTEGDLKGNLIKVKTMTIL